MEGLKGHPHPPHRLTVLLRQQKLTSLQGRGRRRLAVVLFLGVFAVACYVSRPHSPADGLVSQGGTGLEALTEKSGKSGLHASSGDPLQAWHGPLGAPTATLTALPSTSRTLSLCCLPLPQMQAPQVLLPGAARPGCLSGCPQPSAPAAPCTSTCGVRSNTPAARPAGRHAHRHSTWTRGSCSRETQWAQ